MSRLHIHLTIVKLQYPFKPTSSLEVPNNCTNVFL